MTTKNVSLCVRMKSSVRLLNLTKIVAGGKHSLGRGVVLFSGFAKPLYRAVIFVSSPSQLAGYYTASSANAYGYGNYATAYGSSTTVPVTRRSSTYVVIKYLD